MDEFQRDERTEREARDQQPLCGCDEHARDRQHEERQLPHLAEVVHGVAPEQRAQRQRERDDLLQPRRHTQHRLRARKGDERQYRQRDVCE